jgi:hypothetical protein
MSYQKESETEAVAASTAGGVFTSINGLRLSQHPSIWPLRYHASGVCNGQIPAALHVGQTAIYESKRLGDCMVCNAMRIESISQSPTLAVNRHALEHHYAVKQHLVRSI